MATFAGTMDKTAPPAFADEQQRIAPDLARRLARYRRRVEAEGRQRSVRLIDRAIEDAGRAADFGKTPKGSS